MPAHARAMMRPVTVLPATPGAPPPPTPKPTVLVPADHTVLAADDALMPYDTRNDLFPLPTPSFLILLPSPPPPPKCPVYV